MGGAIGVTLDLRTRSVWSGETVDVDEGRRLAVDELPAADDDERVLRIGELSISRG